MLHCWRSDFRLDDDQGTVNSNVFEVRYQFGNEVIQEVSSHVVHMIGF